MFEKKETLVRTYQYTDSTIILSEKDVNRLKIGLTDRLLENIRELVARRKEFRKENEKIINSDLYKHFTVALTVYPSYHSAEFYEISLYRTSLIHDREKILWVYDISLFENFVYDLRKILED